MLGPPVDIPDPVLDLSLPLVCVPALLPCPPPGSLSQLEFPGRQLEEEHVGSSFQFRLLAREYPGLEAFHRSGTWTVWQLPRHEGGMEPTLQWSGVLGWSIQGVLDPC